MDVDRLSTAQALMEDFAQATGLTSEVPPERYLWTDAVAVCTFLELHTQTEAQEYVEKALRFVDQVHQVLGRHRADESRSGWISGLGEEEGAAYPTAGGLCIGKEHNERQPS